jgi:hypothetical protein
LEVLFGQGFGEQNMLNIPYCEHTIQLQENFQKEATAFASYLTQWLGQPQRSWWLSQWQQWVAWKQVSGCVTETNSSRWSEPSTKTPSSDACTVSGRIE